MLNARDFGRFYVRGPGSESVTMLLSAAGIDEWPPPKRITHLAGKELTEPMTLRGYDRTPDHEARGPNRSRGASYRFESDIDSRA